MIERITHDFETRSKSNLRVEGAYKYSLDPSTQPTCLAFKKLGDPKIYILDFKWINTPWRKLPEKFRELWSFWIATGYEFSAHNSFFEMCIYDNILVKRYGWPKIDLSRRRCTAAKAAACSLPRSLENAGEALKLTIQKDKRGLQAMWATCRPTKKWNAWTKARAEIKAGKKVGAKKFALAHTEEPPVFLEPHRDPQMWDILYTYCKIDVKAEELLDQALPDLIPQEQELWFLNQKLNWRGLQIDISTTKKIVDIMSSESKKKLEALDSLTMGLVTKPGSRKSILDFLALEGIELPDIRAKTVQDNLDGFVLTDDARALLEIRKALSKTSTKKYQSFLNRATSDDRVRDIQLFHGASTGRDTGTGIQVHNFPRRLISQKQVEEILELLQQEDTDELSEWIECFYGNLGMVFSSLLRSMIIASKRSEFCAADFAKIEVAVCWWLADNWPGLKILNQGLDPYKFMAAANTGKTYEEIADEGDDRQLGKAQILGSQFGMGATKFKSTAYDMYRLKLTDEQAKLAITNYRTINAAVPALWKTYEQAAVNAVETPSGVILGGKCEFQFKNKFLWIKLPSGRRLAYREPQISWRESDYGPRKTLEFWAVNSKTKKWSLERTWGGVITENITQAVARDLLMYGAMRLEKAGYSVKFSVHDELICEKSLKRGAIETFTKILCEVPPWGKGLPIEAKGWVGSRYKK